MLDGLLQLADSRSRTIGAGIRAVSGKHPSVPRRNINKQLAGIYVRIRRVGLRVDIGRYLSARRRRRANKAAAINVRGNLLATGR